MAGNRTECPFRGSCYRRNPHHFREYSHAHLSRLLAGNPTLALPSDTPLPPNLSLDSLKQQLTIYRDIEKGLHTNKGEGYPSNTAPSVPTNRAPVSKPPIEMFCIKCGTNFLFFLKDLMSSMTTSLRLKLTV